MEYARIIRLGNVCLGEFVFVCVLAKKDNNKKNSGKNNKEERMVKGKNDGIECGDCVCEKMCF